MRRLIIAKRTIMKEAKRMLAMCLTCVLLVFAMALPASAVSTSGTLYSTATSKTLSLSGKFNTGSGTLRTYTSSNDGVNYYLDYALTSGNWKNIKHIFAEPGASATTGTAYPGSSYWRAVMNSWWPNGTGCYAYGTLTAN